MYPNGVWGELAAFLKGATYLSEFKKLGCNYWDANAKAWPPNAGVPPEEMRVGKVYGSQWRSFNGIDQLEALVDGLHTDPTGRRHLLTTYNPAELHMGCLPPCHLMAQFNVTPDHCLDCCVYMRSVDLCLGLPSDVILYATLVELLCNEPSFAPGKLVFMFGDTHIYENHVDNWLFQQRRRTHPLPFLRLEPGLSVFNFNNTGITLNGYEHNDAIPYNFNV
jgi:thymidylate synthase